MSTDGMGWDGMGLVWTRNMRIVYCGFVNSSILQKKNGCRISDLAELDLDDGEIERWNGESNDCATIDTKIMVQIDRHTDRQA